MEFTEIYKILDVLNKLGDLCPCCGRDLLQGDIYEYYDVWCECGIEIRIRNKDTN